jgi:hypothetical protein
VSSGSARPADELRAYLEMLAGEAQAGQFFNLRWLTPVGRMRQQFRSARQIGATAERIERLAETTEVFIGVALRDRRRGGKAAISGSRLLYLDCDGERARDELAAFAYSPTMEVASGTPDHLHPYWCLDRRVSAVQVESANRRLAVALGADPACVDVARILRPPGTFNYKSEQPRAVRLLAYRPDARYSLAELLAGLPGDPSPLARAGRGSRRRAPRTALELQLLAIPAAEYVRVLTGREPNLAGKVLCPFHEETNPSFQLYADGTFYCYGRHSKDRACRKGGTIFDFAAALWGLGTRGRDFNELCERLAAIFHVRAASRSRGGPVRGARVLDAYPPGG